MKHEQRSRFLAIALCLPFLLDAIAVPADGLPWRIEIDRKPQLDGSVNFDVDVPSVNAIIHLPNGDQIIGAGDHDRTPDRQYHSLSELKQAFVGSWKIENLATPFIPHEEYAFAISDFPESAFIQVPANIVFPVNGSKVPPEFTMTWAWPAGIPHPNSRAIEVYKLGPGDRFGASGGAHSPTMDVSDEVRAAFSSGGLPEKLQLRAGSWQPEVLAGFVSEVTPLQTLSRFIYTVSSPYYNYSPPIEVFVAVPEPNASTLLVAGFAIVLATGSRTKR